MVAQPSDQELSAGVGTGGHLDGGPVRVAGGGVDVGAIGQEQLGGSALAAGARLPEGLGDVVGARRWGGVEQLGDPGEEPEGRGRARACRRRRLARSRAGPRARSHNRWRCRAGCRSSRPACRVSRRRRRGRRPRQRRCSLPSAARSPAASRRSLRWDRPRRRPAAPPRRGRSGSSRASRWRCAAGCASCPGGGPRSRSRRWWRALAPPVGSARSHRTPPTGGPDAHLCLDRSLPNVRLRRAARPARHRAHRPAGSRGRRRSARRVCRQLRQGGCSTGSAVTTCRWPPGSPR